MRRYFFPLIILLAIIGIFTFSKKKKITPDFFKSRQTKHQFVIEQAHVLLGFDLVDPEQSPLDERDSVMRGYNLLLNTPVNAPQYVHNHLSCTSCHFCAGDTLGGRNSGISLVGVTNIYPQYSERSKKTIDLTERINNCFKRSMNGKAPPADSNEMKDILAYLDWISKEVEKVKNPPWLGLKFLKSEHKPNSVQGAQIYNTYCVSCHKDDGVGGGILVDSEGKTIPPIWGPDSYNDGAGLSMQKMLEAFIYWNMPYQNSILTEEQAIDVAAFVLEQPRPHFE